VTACLSKDVNWIQTSETFAFWGRKQRKGQKKNNGGKEVFNMKVN
jgi:hypothetical protein